MKQFLEVATSPLAAVGNFRLKQKKNAFSPL